MEPVTHLLTSVALARTGLARASRLGFPMVVLGGLLPELDVLVALGGASASFTASRTLTHSLTGTATLSAIAAGAFWWAGRRHAAAPVRYLRALALCAAGAALHLLLDMATPYGVQLLWPFRANWAARGLAGEVDPWILIVLVAGLLLPALFRMVTEEIGARPAERGRQRAAIAVLAVLALYFGGRYLLQDQALGLLGSRMYHGATPQVAGAFPLGASPLRWRGVVVTENTIEIVEVPLGPGALFDADRSRTYFKPDPSPVLEAATSTETMRRFLQFARFPSASVERLPQGYRVTLRDLRLSPRTAPLLHDEFIAVVELDENARVLDEGIRYASDERAERRR
jgi:inner membrane protein